MHQHRLQNLSKLVGSEGKVDLNALVCAVRNSHFAKSERKEKNLAELEEMHP